MLNTTLRVRVHADPETLWSVLMDRTENPEKYLPQITEVYLISAGERSLIRETVLDGQPVEERFTTDAENGEVTEVITDHPAFTGAITWRLVPTSRQNPVAPVFLECHIEVQPKSVGSVSSSHVEEQILYGFQKEVSQMREVAERGSLCGSSTCIRQ